MTDFYHHFAMSKFAHTNDRDNAIAKDWERIKAENAALKEQVECSDAIISNIECRINILCNKLAAKDETIAQQAEAIRIGGCDAFHWAKSTT